MDSQSEKNLGLAVFFYIFLIIILQGDVDNKNLK